jgi:hypothetical protein
MTSNIVPSNPINSQNQSSPFDAIRGYRADGSEYWTARELMRFLGFSKWDKFNAIVLDAIADIEILDTGSAINHITQTGKSPTNGGRDLIDYELSRLGCYHVALACKQRTLEVAAARRYFAAQTRKQELAPQHQTRQLPADYISALKALVESEEQKLLQAAEIEILKDAVDRQSEVIDELFDYSSIIRIAKFNEINPDQFAWSQLKAASKIKGLEVKKAPCAIWGTKNLYSHDAWKLAYPGIQLPDSTAIQVLGAK